MSRIQAVIRPSPYAIWSLNKVRASIPTEGRGYLHWYLILSGTTSSHVGNVITACPLSERKLNIYSYELLKSDYSFLDKDCFAWCDHLVTFPTSWLDDNKGNIADLQAIDDIKSKVSAYLDLI